MADTSIYAAPPALTVASDSGTSHTDKITNVQTPVFYGAADADVTATLVVNTSNVESAAAQAVAGGQYQVTADSMADGLAHVFIRATDTAGNTMDTSAIDVLIGNVRVT